MSLENTLGALNIDPVTLTTETKCSNEYFEGLQLLIKNYESKLNDHQVVGVNLVSNGQNMQFRLDEIGCINPNIIRISGVMDSGSRVELIQHANQLNFMLISLPKIK